jgi:hypothetical protein
MKIISLLLLSMALLPLCYAQNKYTLVLESGVSTSGIPSRMIDIFDSSDEPLKEINNPLIRPTLGISVQMKGRRNFFLRTGIHYLNTGNSKQTLSSGFDRSYGVQYTYSSSEMQSFSKLSAQLVAGSSFHLRKLRCNYFFGLQKSYFVSGRYDYKSIYKSEAPQGRNELYEVHKDPFSKPDYSMPAKRNQWGIVTGCGVQICPALDLELNITLSTGLKYSEMLECIAPETFHDNNFSLKVRYRLLQMR